jgi:DNA-directed RNA polymerase, mitochondrial
MHTDTNDSLVEAQKAMELRSSKDGYDRYIKKNDQTIVSLGGHAGAEAVKLIKGSIPLVSEKIADWLNTHNSKTGRGKRHQALTILNQLDVDLLSFITLNCIFAGITRANTLLSVQTTIGSQIEAELAAKELEDSRGKKVAARIKATVAKQGSARNARKVFSKLAKDNGVLSDPWDQVKKAKVSEPLVSATLSALPDLLEVVTFPTGKNRMDTVIRLTDAGVQMFASLRESMAWMQPIHRPMVVPPRPWVAYDTGCYYEDRSARTVKLVRTFNADHKKLIREAISSGQMDYVLQSVNAIQSTAWAINQPIVDLVKWCFDNGIEGVGIPSPQLIPTPPKLDSDTWEAMSPQQRKGHRITLAGVHERNRGIVADQAILLRDLETADEMMKYQSFWIPHNLDFRGRVYPVPHFNQQRQDHVKAMFQFSAGCELGEFGIGWLSVHLANCGDFNKVSKGSFDERLQWVEDNENFILAVGDDPYGFDAWKEADSPFMFVAACMEYARWVHDGRRADFVSHLPVALDGSNSGLQHYSAALRAEDEASYVSLTPSAKPADLYKRIADLVVEAMQKDAEEGSDIAKVCLNAGINRSIVKRNVMTFAYSSEQFGFRQQLMDDLMRPINDAVFLGHRDSNPYAVYRVDKETGEVSDTLDGGFSASGYIAACVWRAVTSTVTKATQGMDFFKRVAGALAHEKKPLIWSTPLGLPVMHKYSIWDSKRVDMYLYDRKMPVVEAKARYRIDEEEGSVLKRISLCIRTKPTDRIDKDKARSAVAPNVIHSMDGAHLMLTVLNASYEGIKDFALIHDSFGTHAGKTQRFFQIIRESFVEMYDNYCPFEEVLEYALGNMEDTAKLPPMPAKGSMDLNKVIDAEYAFA